MQHVWEQHGSGCPQPCSTLVGSSPRAAKTPQVGQPGLRRWDSQLERVLHLLLCSSGWSVMFCRYLPTFLLQPAHIFHVNCLKSCYWLFAFCPYDCKLRDVVESCIHRFSSWWKPGPPSSQQEFLLCHKSLHSRSLFNLKMHKEAS